MNRGQLRDRANIFDLQPLEVRRFFTTASLSGGTLTITGTNSAETITVNKNTSNRITITGVSTTYAIGSVARLIINAQGGSDTITITGAVGSNIPSTISAGSGNDVIATGLGDDVIFGQDGFDTVNYSARTSGVTVRLDGLQNDGEIQNGETDNVNVEEVIGGSGNDVFVGNNSSNYFSGGAGNDQIAAAGGSDELLGNTGKDALFGEGGDDSLFAKNNDVDTVNGGAGDHDLAETDNIDVGSNLNSFARRAAIALQAAGIDPAVLDPNYGVDGRNIATDLDWDEVTAATVDSQGRAILVGYDFRTNGFGYDSEDMVAVRFNADGTLDEGFGDGGEAAIDFTQDFGSGYADDDRAFGVTTDADDNIIIVGSSVAMSEFTFDDDAAIVRLNEADGSVEGGVGLLRRYDDVFSDGFFDTAQDAVVQDDGQIVVIGNSGGEGSTMFVLRVDGTSGDLDETFGEGDGVALLNIGPFSQASSVALQTLPDDLEGQRIIVGGLVFDDVFAENFLVVRLTADGAIDNSFAGDVGYVSIDINDGSTDILNDLAVTADNEIIAVGQSYFPIGFATAALDPFPSFSARGAVAHISADGSQIDTDTTNDTDVSFNAVAIGGGGEIYIAGTFLPSEAPADFVLARYVLPLAADEGFNGGELVTTDFSSFDENFRSDQALGLGVLANGQVVVGGSSSYSDGQENLVVQPAVARYGASTSDDNITEVEGTLSYDDVQNASGAGKRSETATFFLKSTHLDDEGRAFIHLTNGNDVVNFLRITAENGDEQILVEVNGLYLPFDLTTTSITIFGLNGDDVITASNDVTVPLRIFGGNGNDSLTGGGADDILNGDNGDDHLVGNDGNDIMVGGNGNDLMSGGDGNDIIIGGNGTDNQNGGNGNDILIGGSTSHDGNVDSLEALMAEWRQGTPVATRINNLRDGGGANGSIRLSVGTGATVFDDGTRDNYTGGNDVDWFFRRNTGKTNAIDVISDNILGEEVTAY